ERIDGRSDLFSLGVVLYQMLCGRKPFVEDERHSVMHKIRAVEPVPPRAVRPRVPRELERVVLRCLCKRREDRYQEALDVAVEPFVASWCRMDPRARLVVFLREHGLATAAQAERWLHPSLLGRAQAPGARLRARRRLLATQVGALAAMALLLATVRAWPTG